jgi:hypothetical protein
VAVDVSPLKLQGSQGDLQRYTSSEENYLAYRIGLTLADDSAGDIGALTLASAGNISVGTFDDTFFEQPVGTHPGSSLSTGTISTEIFQVPGVALEDSASFYRPVRAINDAGQRKLYELKDSDYNVLIDQLISTCFTNEYPGSYRLDSAGWVDGDYDSHLTTVFTDTQTDGTDTSYNIFQRQSITSPPAEVCPVALKRDGGAEGTWEGIQELTNTKVDYSFGTRAKTRIMSSKIGTYQLRTSGQGAPTDPGTWVARGVAVDTKKDVANQDYETSFGSSYVAFSAQYETGYTGLYQEQYVGQYTGTFSGFYGGLVNHSYERAYGGTRQYTGTRAYAGVGPFAGFAQYGGTFGGAAQYTGAAIYAGDYTGDRQFTGVKQYEGSYTGIRNYAGQFTGYAQYGGQFTGYANFIGQYTGAQQYDGVYQGQGQVNYEGVYQKSSQYSGQFSNFYDGAFAPIYGIAVNYDNVYDKIYGNLESYIHQYQGFTIYEHELFAPFFNGFQAPEPGAEFYSAFAQFSAVYQSYHNYIAEYTKIFVGFLDYSGQPGQFSTQYGGTPYGHDMYDPEYNIGYQASEVFAHHGYDGYQDIIVYAGAGGVQYLAPFSALYTAQYSRSYERQYSGQYEGFLQFSGQYLGFAQYSGQYGGLAQFEGTFVGPATYSGQYDGPAQYEGIYSSESAFLGQYTGAAQYTGQRVFTGFYEGLGQYTGGASYSGAYQAGKQYTGATQYSSEQQFTTAEQQFTTQYTGQYTKQYEGQYSGAYEGQFDRQYSGTYTKFYVDDTGSRYSPLYGALYTKQYAGQTIQSSASVIETYTLYVRIS